MKYSACTPLQIIIERFNEYEAYFGIEEIQSWSKEMFSLLSEHKLISPRNKLKNTLTCFECEHLCLMPVHISMSDNGTMRAFIHCTEREDIGQINIPIENLKQWVSTVENFATLLALLLQTKAAISNTSNQSNLPTQVHHYSLGLLPSKKGLTPISLYVNPELGLVLVVDQHSIELSKILTIKRNDFHIDRMTLQSVLEEATNTETSVQRRDRLQKRKKELKAIGVKAFLAQIAKEEGLSISRTKQILAYKEENESTAKTSTNNSPLGHLFNNLSSKQK